MSMPVLPKVPEPLVCPLCERSLTVLVVNPAGELIGCEECARARGLEHDTLTIQEWYAVDVVEEVLRQYGLSGRIGKPDATSTMPPRAHYWEITTPTGRYFLKRFANWYSPDAICHMHSVISHLAASGVPVPRWVPVPFTGESFVKGSNGEHWALYEALDGYILGQQEWMWTRPQAAEMLGHMHNALQGFVPQGEECASWQAWTLETVDAVLDSWHTISSEFSPELLGIVRERLATRYFGELYPELPKHVIHGDFVLSNVLWQKEPMGPRVSGVLDFERTHMDAAIFDFAWGLGDRRPPLLRATLSTYARVHPLLPVEREALPEALLLAALMDIDLQLAYFHNMAEATRLAQELGYLVRDLDALRRAAGA